MSSLRRLYFSRTGRPILSATPSRGGLFLNSVVRNPFLTIFNWCRKERVPYGAQTLGRIKSWADVDICRAQSYFFFAVFFAAGFLAAGLRAVVFLAGRLAAAFTRVLVVVAF